MQKEGYQTKVMKPEKKKELPIYGAGENIREWLFVEDHVETLYLIMNQGKIFGHGKTEKILSYKLIKDVYNGKCGKEECE